ncbi:MAG: serine/threonine-protein kinase, partial [Cyanobacteria bacterium]|nr:serine/threonine-protein kinase [Cyanobacteriota bacterium]
NDFAIGSVVFDKFEILSFISAGGSGRVFKARDLVLDNVVALKVLITDSKNERALLRFQREARTSSKLNHKNIATIYDFGLSKRTPYLSMEFVEGQTLETLLQEQKTLSLPAFTEIFIQVCEALIHAHKHGVVHRDIKPDNIVVRNLDGALVAKVLDFGIAKSVDALASEEGKLTPTGDLVGSPLYMSPEQSQGLKVTFASDSYSLGCVMWRSLTGRPVFRGETALDTVVDHQKRQPEKLCDIIKEGSSEFAELSALVDDLLSKQPGRRPDLNGVVLPYLVALHDALGAGPDAETETPNTTGDGIIGKKKFNKILTLLVACILLVFAFVLFQKLSDVQPAKPLTVNDTTMSEMKSKEFDNQIIEDRKLEQSARISAGKTSLSLRFTWTDEEIAWLAEKGGNIKEVDLFQSAATDKCFPDLAKWKSLSVLDLSSSRVTTLNNLELLANLATLELKDVAITDDSLLHLKPLKKLKRLALAKGLHLTEKAVATISTLEGLQYLDLRDAPFTSRAFVQLRKLKHLRTLNLSQTNVTVDDLVSLAKQPTKLTIIEVSNCANITRKQVLELRNEFPLITFVPYFKTSLLYSKLNLGDAAMNAGRHAEALEYYQDCMDILDHAYGHESDEALTFKYRLANSSFHKGDLKLAETTLKSALKTARRLNDVDTMMNMMELMTGVYVAQRRIKQAEPYMAESLSLVKQRYGANSLQFASKLRSVGNAYSMSEQPGRALQYYQKSLPLTKKFAGAESYLAVSLLVAIGQQLQSLHRIDESATACDTAIKIFEKGGFQGKNKLGNRISAYGMLCKNRLIAGRAQEALALNDKVLNLIKEDFNPRLYKYYLKLRTDILKRLNRREKPIESAEE